MTGPVTVVVVAWQGEQLLPPCLDALLAQTAPAELLVVDNASTDGTAALVRDRYPQVGLVQATRNLGFAGGVALALGHVATPLVALLNSDAVPDPGWLAALLSRLEAQPGCAAVGSKVLLAPGRTVVNSAGGEVDRHGHGRDRGYLVPDDGRFDAAAEVFYAPATAVLLRADAVRAVGGVDPTYFLYHEDVDLCWRLRLAGWSVWYEPSAVVGHELGASSGAASASPLHTFHDARNRLLTLTKDAPAGTAVAAALRLPVTAAGSLARAASARGDGRTELRRARLVLQAWVSFLRLLPGLLAERREVTRRSTRTRDDVDRDRQRLAAP